MANDVSIGDIIFLYILVNAVNILRKTILIASVVSQVVKDSFRKFNLTQPYIRKKLLTTKKGWCEHTNFKM